MGLPQHDATFIDIQTNGDVEITTYYRRGRRGALPFRRISKRAPTGSPTDIGGVSVIGRSGHCGASGIVGVSGDGRQEIVGTAMRILDDGRARGVSRMSEASFRKRLARSAVKESHRKGIAQKTSSDRALLGGTLEVIELLVGMSIIQRDERLDPAGNPTASYLSLTDDGKTALAAMFGPVSNEPREELAAKLRSMLAKCKRPYIADFLKKQLDDAVAGRPVTMDTGEEIPLAYVSPVATPSYVKMLEFFGYLGARPIDESLEFKEISGALYRGERDSVKMLEGLRARIAGVAEFEIGVPLDDMAVRGAHLLYWLPLYGDLRPDGCSMWGEIPAVSTRDVRATSRFLASAGVVALVENRAALEHLVDHRAANRGWLTICIEGMPKHALYELLSKIDLEGDSVADDDSFCRGELQKRDGDSSMHGCERPMFLVWTDWDLGGLRIADKLMSWLRSNAQALDQGEGRRSRITLVPHPRLAGRPIDVPDSFLNHSDPGIKRMAVDIAKHGAVYQEESFSLYGIEALEEQMVMCQSR